MGTHCAPVYANLYLGGWESEIFASDALSAYTDQALCWYRFINDIFIVWTGTPKALTVDLLNENDYNLKFTLNYQPTKVTFLDLQILFDSYQCLGTNVYRKETAANPA